MSSKNTDKLSRLANFGNMAGQAPAAAAHEAMIAAAGTSPVPSSDGGQRLPDPVAIQEDATPNPPASISLAAAGSISGNPHSPPVIPEVKLVRNVVFLPEDQIELDRLEDILRAGGIRKPNLSDLVRVALRSANPQPMEAASLFQAARSLDARRKK